LRWLNASTWPSIIASEVTDESGKLLVTVEFGDVVKIEALPKRMAHPVCKGDVGRRAGLHQRIRSQGFSPGQDGSRALRAS
jgi:hypothetical protein